MGVGGGGGVALSYRNDRLVTRETQSVGETYIVHSIYVTIIHNVDYIYTIILTWGVRCQKP